MARGDPDTLTRRLLAEAGIAPGMRVLDLGSGRGDVSLLLAGLVGEHGAVLGVDRDAAALDSARERARGRGFAHVRFVRCDVSAATPPHEVAFDAIVGRRVLMYLSDPAGVLRRFIALLRPGGIVAVQEHDATMVPGRTAHWPLHDRMIGMIWRTVEREGGNPGIGFALPAILGQAGLSLEGVRAEAVIQGQGMHHPLHAIVHAMLPRIIEHGIADAAELDIDTLERRLAAEREASAGSLYVSDLAFTAWARKAPQAVA